MEQTITKEVAFPGADEFKKKALSLVEIANGIEIHDDDGLQEVAEFLRTIKAERKGWDLRCDPAIKAADLEHKARIGFKKEFVAPLDEAEAISKKKMADYDDKRRAERAAEQKRLDDIALAEAEERRRKDAERVEAENKIRREQEDAERKQKEAEIARLKKEGDKKAAERLAQEKAKADADAKIRAEEDKKRAAAAAAAPLVIEQKTQVKEAAPTLAGATIGRVWGGELEGGLDPVAREAALRSLLEAIVARKAPIYLVMESATEIRKMGESTKGTVKVPGIRFFDKPRVSSRG